MAHRKPKIYPIVQFFTLEIRDPCNTAKYAHPLDEHWHSAGPPDLVVVRRTDGSWAVLIDVHMCADSCGTHATT